MLDDVSLDQLRTFIAAANEAGFSAGGRSDLAIRSSLRAVDPSLPGRMTQSKTQSPWSPLRNTLFRNLWIASIVSNLGTWMHDLGAGWLMTSLSSSPSMVALVEAADSLPVMLLAIP